MEKTEEKIIAVPGEDEQKRKNRLIIVILVLAVLAAGAVIWLIASLRNDSGWREITVKSGPEPDCSTSFSFWYRISRSEGGRDYSAVSAAYANAAKRLYGIFDAAGAHEGIVGMWAVNASPGEAVTVEPELYRAFSLMEEDGGRFLYLAPVYAVYHELFFSSDDLLAAEYDPYRNAETAAYFAELMPFLTDPGHVRLELLGNDTVRLVLSDEYAAFAAENGITRFIDFYWMENAFILDLLAESIAATGYTMGYVVSREGWIRCLDGSGEKYALAVLDRQGQSVRTAAKMIYDGPMQIVSLHDHTEEDTYSDYYFAWPDGSYATAYADPADGYYKSAYSDLILYGRDTSCAGLLLAAAKMMIADEADPDLPGGLDKAGIWAVFRDGNALTAYGPAEFEKPQN